MRSCLKPHLDPDGLYVFPNLHLQGSIPASSASCFVSNSVTNVCSDVNNLNSDVKTTFQVHVLAQVLKLFGTLDWAILVLMSRDLFLIIVRYQFQIKMSLSFVQFVVLVNHIDYLPLYLKLFIINP